jgi:hypothetical protein
MVSPMIVTRERKTSMRRTVRHTSIRAGILIGTFALGYAIGSVSTTPAEAQLGDMLKGAAQSGTLGPVGDLGTSIVEMQDHVSGLQKNLDTLRKVKAALGG